MMMFIRSSNIIVHKMLSRTIFPANVNNFLSIMMAIVMFDLLDIFEDFNIFEKSNLFDFYAYINANYLLTD